jgi:preprotein translocase subunit SecG
MFYALVTLHVLVSILLVLVVLLQAGRGAELGAAFGSMGQANFGRTPTTFLSKFTTGVAVVFMVTSLSLAFIAGDRPGSSVLAPAATAPQGTQPAAPPAAPAGQPAPQGAAPAQQPAPKPSAPIQLPAPPQKK